ncbi:MAG TPA: SMC-Scp complex subunit ScpB [Candidatus Avimonas sp.]|nr:SMC-Scp complex subunit ScpB [Clostridiales bacterium]HPU58782.1 SMC-Scp complex subunit ScpB [Candidatus Avimonas sp.]
MEIKQYQSIIEAILFASGEPVELGRIAEVLEIDADTAERLTEDLMHEVNTRDGGLMIVKLDKSYQMCTKNEYAEYIRKALDIRRNTPLSQAAMEVLAIIAYNQPVTKAFVDQVRGVDCGAVIQGLVAKNLVEEKGRLELPGRPLVYGTTADFLRCFGISSLNELPAIPQKDDSDMVETNFDEIIEENSGNPNESMAAVSAAAVE